MYIIDYNQVTIAAITVQYQFSKKLDEDMIRHMVLNSLRMYRTKFKEKYGEMVIAADSTDYWRKKEFPQYKQHRKDAQKGSSLDWNELFRILNMIRDEIRDNFPYPLIRVDHAEADDVIGVLCNANGKDLGGDPILIVSGDHDFRQLQKFSNVEQWAPTQKKFVKEANPVSYLKEHIIRGDPGDGIPNFLSDDDTFVTDKIQKSIMKAKVAEWLKQEPEDFCDDEMLRNYRRNEKLVDLSQVPDDIGKEVIEQYEDQQGKPRGKMFNYFIKNKLKNLMSSMNEF